MRRRIQSARIVTVIVILTGTTLLTAADRPGAKTAPKAPEGLLLIDEDVWYQLADEPERHFYEARKHFLNGQHEQAAADIRKGVAMLKLAAANISDEAKKPLQASILELETLAAEEGHAKVHSARTLDRIFSRAFFALAVYNEAAARKHLAEEEPYKAGFHVRAARKDVERAVFWRGEGMNDTLLHALGDAEGVAAKMLKGAKNLFGDAAKSLDAMHAEFKDLEELLKAAE